MALRSIV